MTHLCNSQLQFVISICPYITGEVPCNQSLWNDREGDQSQRQINQTWGEHVASLCLYLLRSPHILRFINFGIRAIFNFQSPNCENEKVEKVKALDVDASIPTLRYTRKFS